MKHSQVTEEPQAPTVDPNSALRTGPLLQCAALLFVAAVSSFIGAGFLLASI